MSMGSFQADLSAFAKKAEMRLDLMLRRACLEVLTSVVMMTPVDTGRARGSWTVGVYSMPGAFNDDLDKSGGRAIADGSERLSGAKFGKDVFIMSNVEYMPALEYGHSKQAPQGMVRRSIHDFQNAVNTAAREVSR